MSNLRYFINSLFDDQDAFSVMLYTTFTILVLWLAPRIHSAVKKHGVVAATQLLLLDAVKKVPFGVGRKLIDAEIDKVKQSVQKSLPPPSSKYVSFTELPAEPVPRDLLRKEMLYQLSLEKKVRNKRGHGGIYVAMQEKYDKFLGDQGVDSNVMAVLDQTLSIGEETYLLFSHTNCLYPFLFPGPRKFELDLLAWTSQLLHATECAANMTSGGTESIFLAVKTWRSYAQHHKNVDAPNMVLSTTAHPAFTKAADYLNVELRFAPFVADISSPKFGTVDLAQMDALIDANTICLVGSAPCFPYSAVDDIAGICELAEKHRAKFGHIPVHVDHCLGAFVLTLLDEDQVAPFDFRVKGVCSISFDLHKHGGADKGTSVILYARAEYRRFQYYCFAGWPGGFYANATFQGAHNGGLKAVAWSVLLSKGQNELKKKAQHLFVAVNQLRQTLTEKIPCCQVLGTPIGCGVAFKFVAELEGCDYAIAEALSEVGQWDLVRMQFPPALFFQAGHGWIDEIPTLIEDLTKAVALVMKDPAKYKKTGMAGVYGTAATFPDRSMIEQTLSGYLDAVHTPTNNGNH